MATPPEQAVNGVKKNICKVSKNGHYDVCIFFFTNIIIGVITIKTHGNDIAKKIRRLLIFIRKIIQIKLVIKTIIC